MHLRDFLFKFKIKQLELCSKVGITPGYCSELVNGKATPSLELSLSIDKFSAGWVTPFDWKVSVEESLESYDGTCSSGGDPSQMTTEKVEMLRTKYMTEIAYWLDRGLQLYGHASLDLYHSCFTCSSADRDGQYCGDSTCDYMVHYMEDFDEAFRELGLAPTHEENENPFAIFHSPHGELILRLLARAQWDRYGDFYATEAGKRLIAQGNGSEKEKRND